MENKVVCITGAGRGIGAGMAQMFSENGYDLILHYRSSEKELDALIQKIQKPNQKIWKVQADICDETQVKEMFAWIKKEVGSLDVLINNSGRTKDGLFLRMSEKDFMDVVDVNLKGCFLCSKEAAAIMMRQRNGSIINISSVVGLTGNAGQANYAASKAGIIGLTKSMAKEIGSRNIRVNAIAPGFIQTQMTYALSESRKKEIQSHIPLRTLGSVEDVANVALFLADEKSRYITGEVIRVDGGLGM